MIECDACGEELEFGVVHHCPVGGNDVLIEEANPWRVGDEWKRWMGP